MNPKTLLSSLTALVSASNLAGAAVVVAQTDIWTDGNVLANTPSASIGFDVANADSILVVTAYVDNLMTSYSFSSVDFGGQAPDLTVADTAGRLTSFVFLAPSTASGLDFSFAKINTSDAQPNTSGIGLIFYEVSGADLTPASITSVTGSETITTTTVNELVVSFAGRNGEISGPQEDTPLFNGTDESSFVDGLTLRGGGVIASASATATTIGSQDISWTNAPDGRIAYAFKPVPEPSVLVMTMGALALLSVRRRR